MKNLKLKQNKHETMAISQIFLLIVGIVAIGYAVGEGVGVVSGVTYPVNPQEGDVITDGAGVNWAWYNNVWNGFDVKSDKVATLSSSKMKGAFQQENANFEYSASVSGDAAVMACIADGKTALQCGEEFGTVSEGPPLDTSNTPTPTTSPSIIDLSLSKLIQMVLK